MELSYVAGTNARWYNRIGKLENSLKFKLFLKYDSVVSKYLPRRNENCCSHEYLYILIHSSISNSRKLEITNRNSYIVLCLIQWKSI